MVCWLRYLPLYKRIKVAFEAAWWSHRLVDAVYQSPDTNASWWRPPPSGSPRELTERVLGRVVPLLVALSIGCSVLYILLSIGAWLSAQYVQIFIFLGDWLIWQIYTVL